MYAPHCDNFTSIYYYGTQEQWNHVSIEANNDKLLNATIYYYSESQPLDTTYMYWHFVDDELVSW